MKRILVIIICILVWILTVIGLGVTIKNLKSELAVAQNNEKALVNSKLELQQTVRELKSDTSEIACKLRDALDSLKIKPKKVVEYKYIKSSASRVDTVTFKDTLFTKEELCVDTIISDQWYTLELGLEYPGTITVSPKFKSEKFIVATKRRETIKPPRKTWFGRLFQRKHDIIETEVIENNPYIITEDNKFVKVIK